MNSWGLTPGIQKGIIVGALEGKTLFITGASRGIGHAIGMRAAKDGANIVIAAKTKVRHPKLPGTIYTAAKEMEAAGGKVLPLVVDIRSEEQVQSGVHETIKKFGSIDILVNNASAIFLSGTLKTPMKRYDLMDQVNVRGTFICSKACIPHLKKATNPHILNMAPPLNMESKWFAPHVAYTLSKYGMSMCVLGMAEELKRYGIAVNALWPKTTIATAAVNMLGGEALISASRKPEIMADAAYQILIRDSKECTGNFFLDETVLKEDGDVDLDSYSVKPGNKLQPDFFV